LSYYVYKRIETEKLVPGMILGKMIIMNDGKNFLTEGAVLNLRIIQRIQLWGFRYIDVREEVQKGSEPQEQNVAGTIEIIVDRTQDAEPSVQEAASFKAAPETTEARILKNTETRVEIPALFLTHYQSAVQVLKGNLARVRFVKDCYELATVRQMVTEHILPLIDDDSVMDNIQTTPHSEDYLYHHSVDVGIVSGCLGLWLGRPFHEIEEIIWGGLLHDVGKALIPLKVLNKPGSLTAEETDLMRFHPIRGYNFLKENREVPGSVLFCALQHHERLDGSGYPLAALKDKIHPYAKIIAVADVFDAMISARNYGRRVTPYEAVEVLNHDMAGKLDSRTCKVLVDKLRRRFVGDLVDLDKKRDLSIYKMVHA